MSFDPENKIIYENLTPSLQAKFNNNEFGINLIRMMRSAKQGQDIKIDALNRSFLADDNFRLARMCEDPTEFNSMKSIGPTSQNFISTWDTISTGTPSITFNSASRYILISDTNKSGLISTQDYPFVEILIKVENVSGSGEAGIMIGTYTDSSGVMHDLCLVLNNSSIRLVYNYFSTNVTIYNQPINPATWSAGKGCYIIAKKEYNRIICSCSDIGTSSTINYKFIYDYPNSCPATLNKVYYRAMRPMFRNNNKVGIFSNNMKSKIYIVDQEGIYEDDKLYDLLTYGVYCWEGNSLIAHPKGFNTLVNRTFVYNPYTSKLFWYKYTSHAYSLTSKSISFDEAVDSKAMTGQVLKVRKNGNPSLSDPTSKGTYFSDNFKNLKATDNDYELQELMNYQGISMREIFDTWQRFSLYTSTYNNKADLWEYYMIDRADGGIGTHTSPGVRGVSRYNDPAEAGFINAWTYSAADQTIYNNGNTYPITGFMSNKSYSEYWIEYTVRCNDRLHAGTDYIGAVVSFMIDSKGVPHGLYVARGNESHQMSRGPMNKIGFGLIYDLYFDTHFVLKDITPTIANYHNEGNYFCNWQGAGQLCTFFIGKTTTRISTKTTNYAPDYTDPGEAWDYEFDWDLPETKPASWPDEMWENINIMMKSGPIGLWACSYSTNFAIKKQYEVFDDADIYALHQNKVYYSTDNKVPASKDVYIYKNNQTYTVPAGKKVRIMKNNTTQIYNNTVGSNTTFKVVLENGVLGSDGTIDNIHLEDPTGIIAGSSGEAKRTAYYFYFWNASTSTWESPIASSTNKIPEWLVRGTCSDCMEGRSWVYNSETSKLFFYKEGVDYNSIKTPDIY